MKLAPALVLFLCSPALAQDINIDFGAAPAPAPSYGAVRSYQHYYRDNSPTWCPAPQGSTFNISNAVTIAWQP